MESFYKQFGFIIGFMVMTLIIQMTLGDKFERWFLVLTLCSMVVLNYEKFNAFISEKFTLNVKE